MEKTKPIAEAWIKIGGGNIIPCTLAVRVETPDGPVILAQFVQSKRIITRNLPPAHVFKTRGEAVRSDPNDKWKAGWVVSGETVTEVWGKLDSKNKLGRFLIDGDGDQVGRYDRDITVYPTETKARKARAKFLERHVLGLQDEMRDAKKDIAALLDPSKPIREDNHLAPSHYYQSGKRRS